MILNSLLLLFKLEKYNSLNVIINYKYRGRYKLQKIATFLQFISAPIFIITFNELYF